MVVHFSKILFRLFISCTAPFARVLFPSFCLICLVTEAISIAHGAESEFCPGNRSHEHSLRQCLHIVLCYVLCSGKGQRDVSYCPIIKGGGQQGGGDLF